MPAFTFLLTNPRLCLEAKNESERWSLSFDAKIERAGTFKIFSDGTEHDGYKMDGKLFIECRSSQKEPPRLPSTHTKEWILSTEPTPSYIRLDTIPPEYQTGEAAWPRLGIVASLTSDPLFRLFQASAQASSVEVYVSTPTSKHDEEKGFTFGSDIDGRDIEWRIDNKDHAFVESLRFSITPGSYAAFESKPSQEAKPQEPPASMSGTVLTSRLVTALNRLFWTVVIVGLLLVIKTL